MGTSIEDVRLRRGRVGREATFGTDGTGGAVTFADCPTIEGTFQGSRNHAPLDPQPLQQRLDGKAKNVLGIKSSAVKLGLCLASHGLSLDGSQAAAALPVTNGTGVLWYLATLLADGAMGGYNVEAGGLGAQTKVASGSSTTGITVTAGHGVRVKPGSVLALLNSSTALYEPAVIKTVSTDALTFKQALGFTPTAPTDIVYSGPTCYLKENPLTSVQYWDEGQHDYDKHAYFGLNGGFGFDLKLGELAKVNFDLVGADWTEKTNSSLAAATYVLYSPVSFKDSAVYVSTVGATTRTTVKCAGITITPGVKYEQVRSPGGVNTVLRNMRVRSVPVIKCVIDTYWDNTYDWSTAYSSRADLCLVVQIGSAPGSMVVIEMPTMQVAAPVDKASGSVAGRAITLEGRSDAEIGVSTELSFSALRVSFL